MEELEQAAGGETRRGRAPEQSGEERERAERRAQPPEASEQWGTAAASAPGSPQVIEVPDTAGAERPEQAPAEHGGDARRVTIELERRELEPPEIYTTMQLERQPEPEVLARPTVQLDPPEIYTTAQLERQPEPGAAPEGRGARLPYLAGLDGLRAIAVIAVLIFHAGLGLEGGYLGVESFFVLSGYLITSLLLAEWREQGRVRLTRFWIRRARRLLPALFLVLIATAALAALLVPGAESSGLGGDVVAALAYIMNWHLIAGGQSYFDPMARPPLLQHLWSLAVEEQFYLLWPVLFIAGVRLLRRWGLLAATLALAGLSFGLMAALYQPGADPSRIYYGTDTRASGLLIGSALALFWAPGRPPFRERRAAGPLLEGLGALALCALIAAFVLLHARHPLLYQGGFAAVSLATAAIVAAVTHPRTRLLSRALGWAPLRWVGLRSYGIYLWHWPIFMVTRPRLDLPLSGAPLLALRIGLTLAAAALSYRFVEMPFRHGTLDLFTPLGRLAERLGYGPLSMGRRRLVTRGLGGLLLTTALVVVAAGAIQLRTRSASAPGQLVLGGGERPDARPAATTRPGRAVAAAETPVPRHRRTPAPEVTPEPFDPALGQKLQALLDEVISQGQIPGVVMSVSIPGQEPWLGASGLADLYAGQPMTPDATVRVASVSKMFTAVVVLQLVEEGRLKLDQSVESLLPGLVPDGDRITVQHLLNHTSGLYDFLEDAEFVDQAYQDPGRVWDPAELVAYANEFGLIFEPGAEGEWDYSSTNYVILGMLVEQVTGGTLAQEMRRRIFAPLELERTFLLPDETPTGTLARGYTDGTDQTELAMSFAFGTGNVASTVHDLQHFVVSLFNGRLLKPETMDRMLEFVDGHGQYNMPDLEYGLGVMRHALPVGPGPDGQARPAELSRAFGHIGGFGGFRAAAWFAPESGIAITFAVNQTAVDPNDLAATVFDTVLTHQGR